MTDTLLTFPCDFPIKIIGSHTADFVDSITAIILKHYPNTPLDLITHKQSGHGNYTAISVTVHALDQPSLDALYQELSKFPGIKMVL